MRGARNLTKKERAKVKKLLSGNIATLYGYCIDHPEFDVGEVELRYGMPLRKTEQVHVQVCLIENATMLQEMSLDEALVMTAKGIDVMCTLAMLTGTELSRADVAGELGHLLK